MKQQEFFRMTGIHKIYKLGDEDLHVLRDIHLQIRQGEYLSILGPSGSGKSTLMNIIGCLDTPSMGSYILHGRYINDMGEKELAHLRSREIGFVFQNSQLLPRLNARQNVELPMIYADVSKKERKRRAEEMMETFFFGVDPIGETLYISGIPFQVIGILSDDTVDNLTSIMNGSADILVPYTTAMRLNNVNVVTSFTVYLADGYDSETGTSLIEEEMDRMFSFEEDCFKVTNMSGVEDTMESMLSMVSALLAGIASIALVVGGIGIMNMMLTTVTERTVEIGLKKALGALPWQIQAQFLMESFILSMIGGVMGILIGLLLSYVLCAIMETSFAVSMTAISLGAGFSAAVGIIFGWVPARKASKLNPIDALRSM